MKKRKRKLMVSILRGVGFCLALLFLISCSGPTEKTACISDSALLLKRKRMPYVMDSTIVGSRREIFIKGLSQSMNLHGNPNNDRCFTLRTWILGNDQKYLVELRLDSASAGLCHIVEFKFELETSDSLYYVTVQNEWLRSHPKSGWDQFYKDLKTLGILTMESGPIFKKRTNILTTMTYVQFELLRNSGYRYFEFKEPSFYRFIDTTAGNIHKFMDILNKEFGVEVYKREKDFFVEPD